MCVCVCVCVYIYVYTGVVLTRSCSVRPNAGALPGDRVARHTMHTHTHMHTRTRARTHTHSRPND